MYVTCSNGNSGNKFNVRNGNAFNKGSNVVAFKTIGYPNTKWAPYKMVTTIKWYQHNMVI